MSVAPRRVSNRARFTLLASVAVAVLFVLFSPFGGAPAQAEWNECNNHVVTLDPVPGYGHAVRASTDARPHGAVGVCVLAIGGCPAFVGCFLAGGAVTADLEDTDTSRTGFYAIPQGCVVADFAVDVCQHAGWTGAEVGTSFVTVCVAGICQPVRP
jgi:hypothetical protein